MDDLKFRTYCYENFDVTGDSKVSMNEAYIVTTIECNDATSFAGLEYFTNLKNFKSLSVLKADFRYNRNLETIDCESSNIESVDLRYNDKLTSISFSDCKLLTDVTLPDNLTSIGDEAFTGCSSLISIDIPDGVTNIGSRTFYDCTSLESINIPSRVTIIEDWTFTNCSSLTSIDIPDGVTVIGATAFSGCSSLTSIDIPDRVNTIRNSAFSGCSSLTSIDIPDGVTSIGDYAFSRCYDLKTVDASKCINLKEIKTCAFKDCSIFEFLLGAPNPPYFDAAFNSGLWAISVLKVPAESVEAYKNSEWADYFGTIEAL